MVINVKRGMAKRDSFFIFGIHAARHMLTYSPEKVLEAWIVNKDHLAGGLKEIHTVLHECGVAYSFVPSKSLDRMTNHAVHQGVVLRCYYQYAPLPTNWLAPGATPLYLLLQGIEDPHNLGACLRTADATNVQGIVVPNRGGVGMNGTVYKAAAGAAEAVHLYRVDSMGKVIKTMQNDGVSVCGIAQHAKKTIYDMDCSLPIALLFGSEGRGLSDKDMECCDRLASIPMFGRVESLNVSVAVAITLYEATRQRRCLPDNNTIV